MTRDQLAEVLEYAAHAAESGPAGLAALGVANPAIVAALLAAGPLLELAAKVARNGLDPVGHITRLVDIDPMLAAVRKDVDALEDAKFGAGPDVPPSFPEKT